MEQILNLDDCSCLICSEILIDPVLMPCKHEMCLECLHKLELYSKRSCPFCRTDISSYFEDAHSYINLERGLIIERQFPSEINQQSGNL